MKLFYREDGQSIVIIAVAIALILFIGLGVYNFSEVLNVKAKFRNLSDSASFAGTIAQTKSIYTWLSFNNISPMVVISYQIDNAFNILDDAAGYLVAKSPNFDSTANTINTSTQENIFEDLDKIIKKIAHEPKNPTDLETVDPIFYNYLLSFYEFNGLILAREISENNRNYILNNLNNVTCYTLPSEIILLRAPIQFGANTNSKRFKFKIMMKHGKIIIKYHDQIENEYANSGFFNISIADTPTTLYQNILPVTVSTKIGKMVAFSTSSSYSDTEPDPETPLLDEINDFIVLFEDINEDNTSLVDHMKKNKNNKSKLQADWSEIVSNYNSLYEYVIDNNLLSYFEFDQKENYNNTPIFSSLKGLELLNIEDYKTIASGKGLNPNNPGDAEKFYKTLSLQDIFQTQQNMKYIIEESIDSFSNDKKSKYLPFNYFK